MVRVETGEEKQQSIMFSPLKNELQKEQGNLRDIHPLFLNNHYCYFLEPEFQSKQLTKWAPVLLKIGPKILTRGVHPSCVHNLAQKIKEKTMFQIWIWNLKIHNNFEVFPFNILIQLWAWAMMNPSVQEATIFLPWYYNNFRKLMVTQMTQGPIIQVLCGSLMGLLQKGEQFSNNAPSTNV